MSPNAGNISSKLGAHAETRGKAFCKFSCQRYRSRTGVARADLLVKAENRVAPRHETRSSRTVTIEKFMVPYDRCINRRFCLVRLKLRRKLHAET